MSTTVVTTTSRKGSKTSIRDSGLSINPFRTSSASSQGGSRQGSLSNSRSSSVSVAPDDFLTPRNGSVSSSRRPSITKISPGMIMGHGAITAPVEQGQRASIHPTVAASVRKVSVTATATQKEAAKARRASGEMPLWLQAMQEQKAQEEIQRRASSASQGGGSGGLKGLFGRRKSSSAVPKEKIVITSRAGAAASKKLNTLKADPRGARRSSTGQIQERKHSMEGRQGIGGTISAAQMEERFPHSGPVAIATDLPQLTTIISRMEPEDDEASTMATKVEHKLEVPTISIRPPMSLSENSQERLAYTRPHALSDPIPPEKVTKTPTQEEQEAELARLDKMMEMLAMKHSPHKTKEQRERSGGYKGRMQTVWGSWFRDEETGSWTNANFMQRRRSSVNSQNFASRSGSS